MGEGFDPGNLPSLDPLSALMETVMPPCLIDGRAWVREGAAVTLQHMQLSPKGRALASW